MARLSDFKPSTPITLKIRRSWSTILLIFNSLLILGLYILILKHK